MQGRYTKAKTYLNLILDGNQPRSWKYFLEKPAKTEFFVQLFLNKC